MRILTLMALLVLAMPVRADTIQGFCERDGKRIAFSDGIAFVDARDAGGAVTTKIYLTANPLDRKALAACIECAGPPGEGSHGSPRGTVVEKQHSATADGWIQMRHVGGDYEMTMIDNLMYLAKDGVLTGLDGGNGKVILQINTPTRIAGKLTSEAHEVPYNDTDMNCAATFDVTVGWPNR
ncbi:hypothetical protein [Dokdonella sp.]|uniref:hypothetical protein n=1 Tax=Dokdonella sp. TaxID=2291710 RepID=UPI003C49F3A7